MSEKTKRTKAELLEALNSVINAKRIYRDNAAAEAIKKISQFRANLYNPLE